MKVSYITTWTPTKCGIATYTKYIVDQFSKYSDVHVDIITEKENLRLHTRKLGVHPTFDRNSKYTEDVLNTLKSNRPDLVHIQHEFGIFGCDYRIIDLLKKIKFKKLITLHSVCSKDEKKEFKDIEIFYKKMSNYVDEIIVHQNLDRDILLRQGIPEEKINVIPHGTEIVDGIPKNFARKKLKIPLGSKVLLIWGLIRRDKISTQFLDSLPLIMKKNQNCYLYIVGSTIQLPSKHRNFLDLIRNKCKKLGISKNIIILDTFMDDEDIKLYHNASDVIVFPNDRIAGGASGAIHVSLGMGKLMAISKINKFEDVIQNVSSEIAILPHHTNEWVRIIDRMLNDKIFSNYLINKIKDFARESSWKNIVKVHYCLYKSLIN